MTLEIIAATIKKDAFLLSCSSGSCLLLNFLLFFIFNLPVDRLQTILNQKFICFAEMSASKILCMQKADLDAVLQESDVWDYSA